MLDNYFYYNFGNGSSTGYYAVTQWSNHTAVVGEIIRQLTTPTVGNERCFVCTTGGATGAVEPTWTVTRGALNTSSSAVYQEATGTTALNGDATNTPTWAAQRASATSATLGQVITDNAGTHVFICTVGGGTSASQPTFNVAALGNTTVDTSATWTYIGTASGATTSFTAWGAPQARLQAVVAVNWIGNSTGLFIADNSAETISVSTIITFQDVVSTPNKVLCVKHNGNVPPQPSDITTGATYTGTGTSAITINGNLYVEGFSITAGTTGASNLNLATTAGFYLIFVNCLLAVQASGATINSTGNTQIDMYNTPLSFGSATSSFATPPGIWNWYATPSALQGTLPTTLLNTTVKATWVGVDISNYTGTLVGSGAINGWFLLEDCKLNASLTLGGSGKPGYLPVDYIRCDTGVDNYSNGRSRYAGTHFTDATVYRSGGATNQTTNFSWKIATNSNSTWIIYFPCQPLRIWNNVIGNVTVTVYGTWSGGAVPNNTDIWHEVQYYASSSSPVCTLATTGTDNPLTVATGQTTDSTSTWTNGSTTNFKMTVTANMQQVGYVYVYVKAAKASTTFWIDPQIVLS